MFHRTNLIRRRLLVGLASVAAGCGEPAATPEDGDAPCVGAKCDDASSSEFACPSVFDASGRPEDRNARGGILDRLDDPVARLLLQRPGVCPASFEEIMDKLRLEDTEGCPPDDPRAGIVTRIVSERSQLLGRGEQMRAVIGRECADRPAFGLLMALTGLHADAAELPQNNTELIGFDATAGVFNFYTLRGHGDDAWTFHGSSEDLVNPNVDGNECAACHTDGGLVMKELNSPWVHWEGLTTTPGVSELIDRFEDLGTAGSGVDMENLVNAGNDAWNDERRDILADASRMSVHAGSLRELLRPLFCPTTFNLQSAGAPPSTGGGLPLPPGEGEDQNPEPGTGEGVRDVPTDFFVDPSLDAAGFIEVDNGTYREILAEIESEVVGIPGARDTFFGLTYVERAEADRRYVAGLVAQGILDEEWVKDVLSIDFVNPVFSSARCGLLEFVPDFDDVHAAGSAEDTSVAGNCCEGHEQGPGCDVDEIESCVCEADPFCCAIRWDPVCAETVQTQGCASCDVAEPGSSRDGSFLDALTAAMVTRLEHFEPPEGTAAAQLLTNLQTPKQSEAHTAAAQAFLDQCAARARGTDHRAFVRDVLTIAARRRLDASAFSDLLEFEATMVVDSSMPAADDAFDPQMCSLRGD